MKKDFRYLLMVFCALMLSIQGCKNDTSDQNSSAPATITINNLSWQTKNMNLELPGSWCYDDTPSYCDIYGRLYSFDAAIEACATLGPGWRIPTLKDWSGMVDFHGGFRISSFYQKETAFSKLIKGGGSGFNAVRGGAKVVGGYYADIGNQAYFWTSTKSLDYPDDVFKVILFQTSTEVVTDMNFGKDQGASCRCVKEN